MINIQPTPNDPRVDTIRTCAATIGERTIAPTQIFARTTLATVLIVAAIAALAITSLAQSNERAAAQSSILTQPAP
jgi:hypothetical protein